MPHVAALYRHPVKGFTPESRDSLVVRADGRIEGDRVLAFRFANATEPVVRDGLNYWPKTEGLAMQDTPSIGPLTLTFDDDAQRVRLAQGRDVVLDVALDDGGRRLLCDYVTTVLLEGPQAQRLREPGRLPLVLVGDGRTSQFQDRLRGFISVHGRGSLLALSEAVSADLDERRFRSNIAVDGLDAWDELAWAGRVRIGAVEFEVSHQIVRCLATHANPETGERDAEVLTTLTRTFGHEKPSFGTLLLPAGASAEQGGTIHVGDEVEVLG